MLARTSLAVAALLATSLTASAAPQLARVRGTVESATDTSVTVKTADGRSQQIALAPDTAFLAVVKSSLDAVKDGKFIGTATKGDHPPVALEVSIFPADMKGTGEGHYDWDQITDTTKGGLTKSAMTNGTIKSSAKPLTKSAMTNGTIKSGSADGGAKTIDITYDNGQSLKVKVPTTASIVEFEHADKSILKPGGQFFTVAAVGDGGKLTGKLVAVGKDGLTPPM